MTEKKDTPQEIDLIELFSNIGNWIGKQLRWILNILLSIFYFFLRNAIWFSLFIIIGVAFGFYFHKITKLFYHSDMVGYSHTISNSEVIQGINNWNYRTSFSEEDNLKIKSIKASYMLDLNDDNKWDIIEDVEENIVTDTNIIKQRVSRFFSVEIEVYDTAMIPPVKKALFSYFYNNQRVVDLNNIRIKLKKEMLPKLQKEIDDLNRLKEVEYFENNKATTAKLGEMIVVGESKTQLYHEQILELTDKMQIIERDLAIYKDPFEIIIPFSVPSEEDNNSTNIMISFVKLFFIIGFFVILFFDKRKFILYHLKKAKGGQGWEEK